MKALWSLTSQEHNIQEYSGIIRIVSTIVAIVSIIGTKEGLVLFISKGQVKLHFYEVLFHIHGLGQLCYMVYFIVNP